MQANREIEIKFDVRPEDAAKLLRHPRLAGAASASRTLRSTYYDTPDRHVDTAGFVLRVRRDGDRFIQTIKGSDGSSGFARGEWEQLVATDALDMVAIAATPLGPAVASKKVAGRLGPLFTIEVERRLCHVAEGAAEIEIAFDVGRAVAGDVSRPICELEMELKGGDDLKPVFALARDLVGTLPLRLSMTSKSDRGLLALENAAEPAERGGPITLSSRMSAGEAFRAVAHACLRQILRNIALIADTRSVEALHQARVGVRKMRAVMNLFKSVVTDDTAPRLSQDLKWLARLLGEARDLDVFIRNVARPDALAADADLAAIVTVAHARRDVVYGKVVRALGGRRLRLLVLDLAEWIEVGPWTASDPLADERAARRETPVTAFATAELKRRRKKLVSTSAKFGTLDTHELHRTRIRAKKLRYACQFFEALCERSTAQKRYAFLEEALASVQETLGRVQDNARERALFDELAKVAGRTDTSAPPPAETPQDKLVGRAARALDQVAEAKGFWRKF